MGVHLEPVTAVLRVGEHFSEYGDPYEFSATVLIRGHRAELVGGAGCFNPNWRREICDALLAWGITEIVFDRRGTRPRPVTVKTYRPTRSLEALDPQGHARSVHGEALPPLGCE